MHRTVVNGLLVSNLALLVATSRAGDEPNPADACVMPSGSASFEIVGADGEADFAPDTASDTGAPPAAGPGLIAFDLATGWAGPGATGHLILTNPSEDSCAFTVLAAARGEDLSGIDAAAIDPAAPPEGFDVVAHGELGGAIWSGGSLTPGRAKIAVTDLLSAVDCGGARVAVVGCDGVTVLTDLHVSVCEPTCEDEVPEVLVEPL